MKKFILFALCACISLGMSAAKKNTKKKKSKEPVEVVDTVSIDTFSYFFGRANSNGLKGFLVQRMGIDTTYVADFLKGFEQLTLTEADKREKARLAGIEIRQQVEQQVYPGASKQVNDSTDILNKELFVKVHLIKICSNDCNNIRIYDLYFSSNILSIIPAILFDMISIFDIRTATTLINIHNRKVQRSLRIRHSIALYTANDLEHFSQAFSHSSFPGFMTGFTILPIIIYAVRTMIRQRTVIIIIRLGRDKKYLHSFLIVDRLIDNAIPSEMCF